VKLRSGPEILSVKEARERALAQRKGLSAEDVIRRSQVVVERFQALSRQRVGELSSPDRWKGRSIALYQALPAELNLTSLERKFEEWGARLFFPRVMSSKSIEFVEMSARDAVWEEGPYGIKEPHRDLLAVDGACLDAIFVPGSAYGTSGERIGMGRGYYDRFLARLPGLVRLALAFDFQLFERISVNPWDQPVDWIVTETREIRNARAQEWLNT
jgi:5-formyltetrahydrofolate cyclo-ligase